MKNILDSGIEKWLPVVGYEQRYSVSNHGRVMNFSAKSKRILGGSSVVRNGKVVHFVVGLSDRKSNKQFLIHQLVMRAFVGPPDIGMEVCHNDGDARNNRLDNLRWGTRLENQRDRISHGTSNVGMNSAHSKLSHENIRDMRKLFESNAPARDVAKQFSVSVSTAYLVRRGASWSHVT